MRQAWCHRQLEMLRPHITGPRSARDLGTAYSRVTALRLVARRTLRRLAEGDFVGPEASIDKLLLSSSEQMVLNLARDVLAGAVELDDDPELPRWRAGHIYNPAAPVLPGAAPNH